MSLTLFFEYARNLQHIKNRKKKKICTTIILLSNLFSNKNFHFIWGPTGTEYNVVWMQLPTEAKLKLSVVF